MSFLCPRYKQIRYPPSDDREAIAERGQNLADVHQDATCRFYLAGLILSVVARFIVHGICCDPSEV
jgi:hypothetical protein